MIDRRQLLACGGAAGLGLLAPLSARAQAYPGGAITVVLPLQAASASDVAVRHMADRLGQRMTGNSFVVENVAAAAGLVGLERISRARPDGRTVALGSVRRPPWQLDMVLPAGTGGSVLRLRARAWDDAGQSGVSQWIGISVR